VPLLFAFSLLFPLFLPTDARAQQLSPIAEQVAKTYGLDAFGQIEGIRFTNPNGKYVAL
jgi:hypothetical protein